MEGFFKLVEQFRCRTCKSQMQLLASIKIHVAAFTSHILFSKLKGIVMWPLHSVVGHKTNLHSAAWQVLPWCSMH